MKQPRNKQPGVLTRLSAATALAVCASAGNAGLIDGIVDVWTVDVNAVFNTTSVVWDALEPDGTVVNNQLIQWGTGTSGPSSLSIGDSPANANVNTNGPAVANISVTHANNPINADSGELDSIKIDSTLTLTPFDPGGAALPAATLTFTVLFDETPNDGDADGACLGGGQTGVGINLNGCADVFVIDQDALNFPFFYDLDGAGPLQNQQYFISFFEITNALNPLAEGACTTTGATSPCIGFLTPENATTTFTFAALITTEPVSLVPVPATFALVALGLAGLSYRAANRKRPA
jgi:hypothetical protein